VKKVNLVIVGPCGVGKSSVAKLYAIQQKIKYLDFDAIGLKDMEEHRGKISPFSIMGLNFKLCLPKILDSINSKFILDIGGDNVFRFNVDNNERLAQIIWVKKTYSAQVIVLEAIKEILLNRFIDTKHRKEIEFEQIWKNWQDIANFYWGQCGDIFIDTSFLSIEDTLNQIDLILTRFIK
jgi:shikimate kinase